MKRLMILMALSILSEILVSCGASTKPSTPYISPSKAPTASVPRPSATPRKLSPTASVPRPSATPHKLSPTATTESNLFSLPVSSDVPPGDVLAQIAYGGKGAGGDEEEEPNFRIQDGEITFTGQTPHQRIRLIAYKVSPEEGCFFIGLANYLTEWYITLDENGYYRGYIEGDLKNIEIVALDADTGEEIIRDRQYGPSYVDINKVCQEMEQSCWPAPPQRMIVGERGYVCTAIDNVKVRQSPSRSASEIIRLAPGTYFDVQDGPSCSDNWSWWYIETDDGIEGWVSEGGDEIDPYFICPAP